MLTMMISDKASVTSSEIIVSNYCSLSQMLLDAYDAEADTYIVDLDKLVTMEPTDTVWWTMCVCTKQLASTTR